MSDEQKTPKKRRTAAEMREFHQARLKELDEMEKMDLLKLLSSAHDDIHTATTHPQAKGCLVQLNAALAQVKAALATLEPKK